MYLFAGFVISLVLYSSVDAVLRPRPGAECLIPSRDANGNPAHCGGFVGARCPRPSDTCIYYPGSDFGPCCLGCPAGKPIPNRRCGGWVGPPCPRGYFCQTDPFIGDSQGFCCRNVNISPKGYD